MERVKIRNLAILSLFVVFLAAGIVYITLTKEEEVPEYQTPSPEYVVKQYFNSWNDGSYPDMYAAISDGFKKIEPTTKDLTAFKGYAESQGIEGVNILSIK